MITVPLPRRHAEIFYRLKGLGMAGAVLHIGAHPDDEDVGLMAYMARKMGVRIVYWSATRGEGGENRIGPYREETLGVYRTWESLDARAMDGGEALFGPFYDYGYSKFGEEALNKWGRDNLVQEMVRAIRLVQPQIVIARWTGKPVDNHGHHLAIGTVVPEAFAAAGNPACFPELRAQGLPAWQPCKLYHIGAHEPGSLAYSTFQYFVEIKTGTNVLPDLDERGQLGLLPYCVPPPLSPGVSGLLEIMPAQVRKRLQSIAYFLTL